MIVNKGDRIWIHSFILFKNGNPGGYTGISFTVTPVIVSGSDNEGFWYERVIFPDLLTSIFTLDQIDEVPFIENRVYTMSVSVWTKTNKMHDGIWNYLKGTFIEKLEEENVSDKIIDLITGWK